jgi:hypothetical protein
VTAIFGFGCSPTTTSSGCARAVRKGQKFRQIQLYKSSTQSGDRIPPRHAGVLRTRQPPHHRHEQRRRSVLADAGRGEPVELHRKGTGHNLRHDLMGIHNSAVELLTVVGDVLLSSGGNDGKIFGRDKYLHRPDTGHHKLPSGRTIGGRGRRPP